MHRVYYQQPNKHEHTYSICTYEDGGVINKILIVCTSKIRQLVSKTRIKNLLLSYKVRSERNVNPLIIHLLLMHSAS